MSMIRRLNRMPCSVWLISSSSKSLSGETHLGCHQQILGAHDDEGLAELAVHLPSQEVEVVAGVVTLQICQLCSWICGASPGSCP